jgi:hypothetical protein
VKIDLSEDQALVLFQWLARAKPDQVKSLIEDEAEQRVLWAIEAQLDKHLVAPFSPNYNEQVAEARKRVRDAGI